MAQLAKRIMQGAAAVAVALGFGIAAPPTAAHEVARAGECAPVRGLDLLCGAASAEDLVPVPGTRWVIAGGLGTRDGVGAPGGLKLIDAKARTWEPWFPTWRQWHPTHPENGHFDRTRYGQCSGPPNPATMAMHGITLKRRGPGLYTLYGINHAQEERIEIFDVDARGARPEPRWRGCAVFAGGMRANSIAATADGVIYVTVLTLPGKTREQMLAGEPVGRVYSWRPGATEFTPVAGTDSAGPNGIEISPDERTLYIVAFGDKAIVPIDLATGRQGRKMKFANFWADNIHWDSRGRLLAAGMTENYNDCVDVPPGAAGPAPRCRREYVVEAIDPATGRGEVLARDHTTAEFSNVAAAAIAEGRLWLGAYRSTHSASRPLK